jgi:hypothetical protein
MLFHDAATHRDDVPGKIGNKQDIACAEMVGPNKTVKIRAREGKYLAPCTDKVGRDWSLVLTLMGIKVDEAQRRRTDLWGDCEDDHGVIWDLLTAYLMGGSRRWWLPLGQSQQRLAEYGDGGGRSGVVYCHGAKIGSGAVVLKGVDAFGVHGGPKGWQREPLKDRRGRKGVQEPSALPGPNFRTRRKAHDLQVIGK